MSRLLDFLADPSNFTEAMLKVDDAPVRLDPWQKSYLSAGAKLTSILKARRVGGSWIMTAKMFIRSQTIPRYSGVFVSMNREEARGKIDYADELYDSLPSRWRLKRVTRSRDEISFTDSSGRRSTLRSLAAKAPRGRGGDVGISELPHCLNSKAIYEGALHVTARSDDHRLTIESTPLGKGGVFHDISRGAYPLFQRYEVPWWLSSALCVDVETASIEAKSMTTASRVERFGVETFKTIYASMPEKAFRQESELEFVEMENAAFPMELLMACAEAEYGRSSETTLLFRKIERPPTTLDLQWLKRARRGTFFAGYDPGRKKDQAALVILDRVGERFEVRMAISMRDATFSVQRKALDAILRHGVSALAMDSNGIGMDMAERMERAYPGVARGVSFTRKSKEMMIAGGYNLFSDKRITIPAERVLLGELASIREVVSDSGSVLFHAERAGGSHADMAWALLLAVEAARGSGASQLSYEPLVKRGRIAF
ncbi:hypothetical protein MNBD_NITROSPINAE04-1951 [hydrothermal vent metagenome]|uniref:Terminase large subunit gp17-like C-terminal domain-containing protein n=1 Tax=hydrothermal vent metagenome TaxID=652676 RepID=A0A3B1C9K5_9ZZZZ